MDSLILSGNVSDIAKLLRHEQPVLNKMEESLKQKFPDQYLTDLFFKAIINIDDKHHDQNPVYAEFDVKEIPKK